MKKYLIIISIIILITGLSGCITEDKSEKQTYEKLTDEDWNYIVWYYTSDGNFFNYTDTGTSIMGEEHSNFTKFENLSNKLYQEIQIRMQENSKFTLSNRIEVLRTYYTKILNLKINVSIEYYNIYELYWDTYNPITEIVNISLLQIYNQNIANYIGLIADYLEDMENHMNNTISDEEWNIWIKGRDWSFLDD